MARRAGGWVERSAVGLALLTVVTGTVAALSGFGSRWGWWHYRTGFRLLTWSAFAALAIAVLALLVLVLARRGPPRAYIAAGFALLGGILLAAVPYQWQARARSVPPIHDITTDPADPPAFVAVAPLRADAPNPIEYPGEAAAAQQRAAYGDIQPVILERTPDAAYEHALETARSMGWQIIAADRADARIEATDRTFWFGFYDDVVIRLTPAASGTRVDVRSKSRVGRGDAGTNARRVRAYLEKLR